MFAESAFIFSKIFSKLKITGNIFTDISNFLIKNDMKKTLDHSVLVAEKGVELASIFRENQYNIKLASYLHDVSAVIPNEYKIEYSEINGIEILKEEKLFPMLIHQKISKDIAKKIFKISDTDILNAIECHSTLKADPSKLDMILFISDKIKWDQEGIPPYIDIIENNLNISLNDAVKEYLNYLMNNKHQLKVLHPSLAEACQYFNSCLKFLSR